MLSDLSTRTTLNVSEKTRILSEVLNSLTQPLPNERWNLLLSGGRNFKIDGIVLTVSTVVVCIRIVVEQKTDLSRRIDSLEGRLQPIRHVVTLVPEGDFSQEMIAGVLRKI